MTSLRLDLHELLGAAAHEDPTGKALVEIRDLRSRCQEVESALSYARRVVQGRLDIAGTELRNRRDGGGHAETSDLIASLPIVLSERSRRGGMPRPPLDLEPPPFSTDVLERIDKVVEPADLGRVNELSDAELEALVDELGDLEQQLSEQRSLIHEVQDRLQAEVVRQYRTGVASVDDLLA